MLPVPIQWYSSIPLRILPLDIAVRWQRPAHIPPHLLPNVLRGAFNITFRRLVCPPEWFDNACPPCPLYQQCPYGQLFEPTPSETSDRLRLQADLPRPFVLKPPPASFEAPEPPARQPSPAQRLEFGLVLFGRAIDQLSHFIVTLAELGRAGMGRDRIPFTIESVASTRPGHGEAGPIVEPLYNPATHTFTPPRATLNASAVLTPDPDSAPATNLSTLRFVTPTLIRTGSGLDAQGRRIPAREVRDRPGFGILARRLRDRLSSLTAFFGEGPWTGPDFAELGRLADEVRLIHSETRWQHRTRRSTRTDQTHELSGLVGTATYEFPTPAHRQLFEPLLKLGTHLHLGKHAVWGNGWVETLPVECRVPANSPASRPIRSPNS